MLACVSKHIHAEVAGYARHFLADMPKPDYSNRLASQLRQLGVPIAKVGIAAPAPLAVGLGIVGHTVGYVQNVGKHHLGHTVSTVCRDIGDAHTVLLGSLNVNHIVSCGQHPDILQVWQLAHCIGVDYHLVGKQGVGILAPFQQLIGRGARIYHHLAHHFKLTPRQIAGVDRVSIQNNNLHLQK